MYFAASVGVVVEVGAGGEGTGGLLEGLGEGFTEGAVEGRTVAEGAGVFVGEGLTGAEVS